jgi:hypothetical protein
MIFPPAINVALENFLPFPWIAEDIVQGLVEFLKCSSIAKVDQPLALHCSDAPLYRPAAALLGDAKKINNGVDVIYYRRSGAVANEAKAIWCMQEKLADSKVVNDKEVFLGWQRTSPIPR